MDNNTCAAESIGGSVVSCKRRETRDAAGERLFVAAHGRSAEAWFSWSFSA
jgi:hypothetical protein